MILENIDIDIDIDKAILQNIDIDKAILQNIDIDKISYRFVFGISNSTSGGGVLRVCRLYLYLGEGNGGAFSGSKGEGGRVGKGAVLARFWRVFHLFGK